MNITMFGHRGISLYDGDIKIVVDGLNFESSDQYRGVKHVFAIEQKGFITVTFYLAESDTWRLWYCTYPSRRSNFFSFVPKISGKIDVVTINGGEVIKNSFLEKQEICSG